MHMTARYNWWQDRWECDCIDDAKSKADETNGIVLYRINDKWKEYIKY